jgi:hypothetical protein
VGNPPVQMRLSAGTGSNSDFTSLPNLKVYMYLKPHQRIEILIASYFLINSGYCSWKLGDFCDLMKQGH